jgi:serine/threonine protein kinase/tetratricopeptide (TPR) repeat protein
VTVVAAPLACSYCRIALASPETVCPRDGQPGEEVVWDVVPAALGKRFSVLEPFARGGTGSLFLADESESGRRGLLKILSAVPKHREPERARLRRELSKQASLPQNRLVVPWASGETEGVSWLFRPWLDGVSLRVRLHQGFARAPEGALRRAELTTDDALAIAAQLAIALDELHRGGLLHRDLRPGHVFLPTAAAGPLRAQLIEAGVCATLVRPGNSTIFGTPGYVAPEQLSGKLVSFRSDLYSLGCVMYEMLAGRPPFLGESDQEVLASQLSGELPALPDDLPDGIAALLRSLLSREPQERPFSAQKLRRILDPYAPDGSSMNRQPTSTFATLPAAGQTEEKAEKAEKPAEKPAGGAVVSVPPPPPPAALKSTKPGAPPRPTTRGMAPPPPPRGRGAQNDDSSPISVDMLEEIEAPATPPPRPASAETTQELGTEHLFDVRRSAPPPSERSAATHRPPKDATVPIRLEQILAIAPARLRSNAAPPLPEPERAPEPAAEAGSEAHAQSPSEPPKKTGPSEPPKKTVSGFPQPSLQLDKLGRRPGAAERRLHDSDAPAATMENSLFGTLPAIDEADRVSGPEADRVPGAAPLPVSAANLAEGGPPDGFAGRGGRARALPKKNENDADKTTITPPNELPAADGAGGAHHDEAATIAMSASFEHQLANESEDPAQAGDADPQALRETLPPWLAGPFADYRKLAYAGAAVAALVLGVFGMRAILGNDDDEAAAQAAPTALAGSAPTVEPVPAVEPAPSVTALAKPPQAQRTEQPEVTAQALPSAVDQAAAKLPQPAAPPPAQPEPVPAAELAATPAEAPAPPPVVALDPVPVEARVSVTEPSGEASAQPAKAAESEKPAPARVTREDRRRERRERHERQVAEKKASRAEAKAAKAGASGADRESKWADARDLARSHYAAKRYKQAAQAYELASQYDPTNAGTFAGLGAARLQAGDPKGAITAYQRAIQLAPSTAGFHAALGRAYVAVGDRTKARASYQRALSLDPNNATAKSSLKEIGG